MACTINPRLSPAYRSTHHLAAGEIETNDYTGEVIEINARSTVIKTTDWTRIHIPNTDVLHNPITVFTAFERRRSAIELEIEYRADRTRHRVSSLRRP
jgi:small-conductance mechanosensitive channel